MKILKENNLENYDLAIVGIGYESRAITIFEDKKDQIHKTISIGYKEFNTELSYEKNKLLYKNSNAKIIEKNDSDLFKELKEIIRNEYSSEPIKCLLDITVMSRTRLATVLMILIENLKEKSNIKICYELAKFTPPSNEVSPIRKIGPIISSLSGSLGNIELPSSIVIGLGYELGKAIGISNYLDAELQFSIFPRSTDKDFERYVESNNNTLLESIPNNFKFNYEVSNPYKSYLELRELVLAITKISRPIVVPLGPKILSAIFIILSKEFNYSLPVWRVSSEHNELPVDRKPSGEMVELNLEI